MPAMAQTPPSASADPAVQLAQAAAKAQQSGDFQTAIDDYRKALGLRPEMLPARIELGAVLAAAGQFDAAIEEDTRVLEAAPDALPAQINLATAWYRKGNLGRARMQFESIHAAHPDNVSAAIGLAYIYIKLQRNADAADVLVPIEAANSKNLDFEYVLAYALILSGKDAEGLTRMESVAAARGSADAWMIAASTLFQKRQFSKADDDANRAIALNPAIAGAKTLAGQADYALGDKEKAAAEFQIALRQDPRDFTANLYLGIIRSDQRDFDTARPLLELAVEISPTHPLARLELAKVNAMTGHYDDAVQTLESLEKSDPDWIEPHIQLATLYYKVHRPDDGQRERQIVQQLEDRQQKAGPQK